NNGGVPDDLTGTGGAPLDFPDEFNPQSTAATSAATTVTSATATEATTTAGGTTTSAATATAEAASATATTVTSTTSASAATSKATSSRHILQGKIKNGLYEEWTQHMRSMDDLDNGMTKGDLRDGTESEAWSEEEVRDT
ncbi:hypothetical protein DYB30_002065, partial [Aphanomyces astaci]